MRGAVGVAGDGDIGLLLAVDEDARLDCVTQQIHSASDGNIGHRPVAPNPAIALLAVSAVERASAYAAMKVDR